jgi:uncharacterized membrane protein
MRIGGGDEIGMMFIPFIFVVIVMALIYTNGERDIFNTSPAEIVENPVEILKKRYARGEIDRAGYEERKLHLL